MKRFFKKYFLPHAGNNFRPHFFRAAAVLATLLVLGGSFYTFSKVLTRLPQSGSYAALYIDALISHTNEARRGVIGERGLVPNETLTKAAQMKADDMAEKGYFAHNSPDGKTPWYWIEKAGYAYKYAGENLAVNFTDSLDVTNAWMASPGHRANILNRNFSEIGMATAVGTYNGKEVTFVVEIFGTPAEKVPEVVTQVNAATEANQTAVVVPEAVEEMVAGAYLDETTPVTKAVTSPSQTMAEIYRYAGIFFVLLTCGVAFYELKRHHKSIWLSGAVLAITAFVLWLLTANLGQGAI